MNASVIRPGLLVAMKSTLTGGVEYERRDLPAEESASADGAAAAAVARWETTRVIRDVEEHNAATKARSKAVKEIRSLCAVTSFGLLCPEAREADLDAAVLRARAIVDAHNGAARHTKINVFVLKGRIASSDTEAARAIGQEVAGLIEGMDAAINNLDPEAIREIATKAREMSAMLSPEMAATVGEAVEAARKAARQIAKRIEKKSEDAAVVLADIQRGGIQKARIAFLDFNAAPPPPAGPALPAFAVGRFASLMTDEPADLAVEPAPVVAAPPAPAEPSIEVDADTLPAVLAPVEAAAEVL